MAASLGAVWSSAYIFGFDVCAGALMLAWPDVDTCFTVLQSVEQGRWVDEADLYGAQGKQARCPNEHWPCCWYQHQRQE